jgi:NADH-quinone oxidoreductase subunit L
VGALFQNFPPGDFGLLAVVLLAPAIGAFVNGVFGKRLGKEAVRLTALAALAASFAASVVTFLAVARPEIEKVTWTAWTWADLVVRGNRPFRLDVAFGVDAMTATMMLIVTGVGFLIHLYSSEYMWKDPGYHRFFAYLNLFIFSMLTLIMGDNLVVLFVGWEGVGLCSYLLIGFWFEVDKYASAGKKAFIVNRIGDFGLLVAMAALLYFVGTLNFEEIDLRSGALLTEVTVWPLGNIPLEATWDAQFAATSMWPSWLAHAFLPAEPTRIFASTLIGLCLFLGAAGKSAQMPLYVWLPDAMAGPTPVSALIHAATMVTAGVYLVARMAGVFVLSPAAMATIAIVGAFTALFAASIGLFQRDLKKVLAYSTVSQLGFMFIGVGTGAFIAGFFHVFTHAFFKACLFLGAGSVIHAMHARIHDADASQDMRFMGGLGKYMPITRATFLVSCLAIAGVPLLSGFWSKDEILWLAFSQKVQAPDVARIWQWPDWLGPAIYVVGIVAATMTAFYMFRAYFMTFHGEFRGWTIVKGWVDRHAHHGGQDDDHDHDHDDGHDGPLAGPELDGPVPHESPWAMTAPLVILAAFAALGGFLGAHPIHVEPLLHFLEPVVEHAAAAVKARPGTEDLMLPMMVPGLLAAAVGIGLAWKIYGSGGWQGEDRFAKSAPGVYQLLVDKWRIDELYDATVVGMVDALADIFTMADKWIVDGIIARLSAAVVAASGSILRLFHSGRVQLYAASIVVGMAALGLFVIQPHADLSIDETLLRQTGEVKVTAAPGLGYSYSWQGLHAGKADAKGATEEPPKFAADREQRIVVGAGETRTVVVRVRNAFGLESEESVTLTRRGTPAAARGAAAPPQPAPAPQPGHEGHGHD